MTKFKAGDRVALSFGGVPTGTIIEAPANGTGWYTIETDEKNVYDHDCDGAVKRGKGYGLYVMANHMTLTAATKPSKTFARDTQNAKLLTHLASGKAITRITADHLYRIAALPRRIADLREAGHKIVATRKMDATGRPYVEYTLRNAGRVAA